MKMGNSDYLERCTSLAILGGTFDPIHNGHLAIGEAVLHQFKPERVLFVPAGNPPHKPNKPITPAEHRYQMILRSVGNIPGLDTNRLELDRAGTSYTIDTIKSFKKICPPNCIIYFVLGQDALQAILTWKDATDLLKLCQFITIPRPGYNPELLQAQVSELERSYGATIHVLTAPLLEVSSTFIRKSITNGKPVSALMPHEAENYARKHGLYHSIIPDLSERHFEWAKSCIKNRLTPKRYKHSMGVVLEAEKLAFHYGADINKARWAGLLHDCTKEYGADKKRILCEQWDIDIDEIVESHIDLAHGLLGAESAKRHFYITDKEILQAIRFHILGHKDITLLDKIIVLADFIEPYREDYHPLKEMRNLAYVDINKALVLGLKVMRDIDATRGKKLHYWSEDAIKTLKGQIL